MPLIFERRNDADRRRLSSRDQLITRLFQLFFYLLYEPFAWTYDFVAAAVSLGRWKRWVLCLLEDLEGSALLELGHGPGHLTRAARLAGLQVYALDRSWQMSRQAYRNHASAGLNPALVNGYAQNIPFSTSAFQQVVATFPSEYFWQPATLAEIARVLQPDGKLIVLPVAWITGHGWLDRAARWLFAITGQAPDPAGSDWLSPLTERLQRAGFHVRTERRHLAASTVLVLHATFAP